MPVQEIQYIPEDELGSNLEDDDLEDQGPGSSGSDISEDEASPRSANDAVASAVAQGWSAEQQLRARNATAQQRLAGWLTCLS